MGRFQKVFTTKTKKVKVTINYVGGGEFSFPLGNAQAKNSIGRNTKGGPVKPHEPLRILFKFFLWI